MDTLSLPVGPGRPNLPDDVALLQRLLDRNSARIGLVVPVSGSFDHSTEAAIKNFQRRVMRSAFPSGIVAPDDATFLELTLTSSARIMAASAGRLRLPLGDTTPFPSQAEYAAAAAELGCEVRTIKAVQMTEAPRGAFDDFNGRPTILFERHLFSRFTGGRFNARYPNISSQSGGGYGRDAEQYARLEIAYALDATAALRAASWGLFQILGNNFIEAGFPTVNLFVYAMCRSVEEHLTAYVSFVKSNRLLWNAVKAKDWAAIAFYYNGKDFRKFHYDASLEQHYNEQQP